jgi:SAM-dependent methyltransferase
MIPDGLKKIVEVGCSRGALARAYLQNNPGCDYVGLEIDADSALLASRICRSVICADVESMTDDAFAAFSPSDCWIFGDSLEHLRDPWTLLRRIKNHLTPGGMIVACIPNSQHWSFQARLGCGLLRYEDQGLLDRTHLRFFTRITMIDLFESSGYRLVEGYPRIFNEPEREKFLPAIRAMALAAGADPAVAEKDAIPLQYVVKAVPVQMAAL